MAHALVIVDVQHDFLPGGAMGVTSGEQVIPVIERLAADADIVIASQDWHPAFHMSFIDCGGQWPAHCIANTHGAALHPRIASLADSIVQKGLDPEVEQYSAADKTPLVDMLRAANVDRVVVCGLATDYCVRATALDLLSAGFIVEAPTDAVRGVDLNDGDSQRALDEIEAAGGQITAAVS